MSERPLLPSGRRALPAWCVFCAGGYAIRCLPPFARFRGLELPWDHPDLLSEQVGRVVKATRSRKVVQLAAGELGAPVELFVKRYNFKTWFGPLLRALRRSRAREEFDLGWKLLALGIPTPRPVWLAESLGSLPSHCLLATETIPEADTALDRWQQPGDSFERRAVLAALAGFLRHMHDTGFYHDDCKATHFLLLPYRAVAPEAFFVIDLLGGVLATRVSDYRRAKNLYQILRSFSSREGFCAAEREHFMETYAGSVQAAHDWWALVRRVERAKGRRIV